MPESRLVSVTGPGASARLDESGVHVTVLGVIALPSNVGLGQRSSNFVPMTPVGPALGAWTEQWERVQLGLARVEAVYKGRVEPEGRPGAYYDTYAFFLHCNHLKDWVTHDPNVPAKVQDEARTFAKTDFDLKLCADVANRSKHSILTTSQTGDFAAGPIGNDVTVMLGVGSAHAFRVVANGQQTDALELAHRCVDAWRCFLERCGLL